MLLILLVIGYFAISSMLPVRGCGEKTAAIRRTIISNYKTMNTAVEHKNINKFLTLLTVDYTRTNVEGATQNREYQRKYLMNIFSLSTKIKQESAVKFVAISSKSLIVERVIHSAITLVSPQTGQLASLVGNALVQDVWVKSGMVWKIKQTKTLKSEMLVNGKPYLG